MNFAIYDNNISNSDHKATDYNPHYEKTFKWRGIALWLLENTAIEFEQIAHFCGLHLLEIEALANGETGEDIKPVDPILNGLLDKETIENCTNDSSRSLNFSSYNNLLIKLASQQGKSRYTPIVKKKNKPDAIAWLIKTHPYISDNQIIKLIGTTKNTIAGIRNKTYKSMKTLKPRSPIALGLCTNEQLEMTIMNAKILFDRMQIDLDINYSSSKDFISENFN